MRGEPNVAEDLPFAWPTELDAGSILAVMLGRPNFWCGPWAHRYQAAGFAIPRKAEAEQAFIIHRIIRFYISHGEGWADAMSAELEQLEPNRNAD
jgi:hypothetical protein